MKKLPIAVLVLMNSMVLLGQVWPEGAPPFARTANIVFLSANLVFLLFTLLDKRKTSADEKENL